MVVVKEVNCLELETKRRRKGIREQSKEKLRIPLRDGMAQPRLDFSFNRRNSTPQPSPVLSKFRMATPTMIVLK